MLVLTGASRVKPKAQSGCNTSKLRCQTTDPFGLQQVPFVGCVQKKPRGLQREILASGFPPCQMEQPGMAIAAAPNRLREVLEKLGAHSRDFRHSEGSAQKFGSAGSHKLKSPSCAPREGTSLPCEYFPANQSMGRARKRARGRNSERKKRDLSPVVRDLLNQHETSEIARHLKGCDHQFVINPFDQCLRLQVTELSRFKNLLPCGSTA